MPSTTARPARDDRGAPPARPSFAVEELEVRYGRVVLRGRWSGVRGLRFMRPTLIAGGREVLASLDHKPWAPTDDALWTAAFPWGDDPLDRACASLAVTPSLTVDLATGTRLPSPTPHVTRSGSDPVARTGSDPVAPVPGHVTRTGSDPVAPVPGHVTRSGSDPVAPVPGHVTRTGSDPVAPVPGHVTRTGSDPVAAVPGHVASPRGADPGFAEAVEVAQETGAEVDAVRAEAQEARVALEAARAQVRELRDARDQLVRERDEALAARDAARRERDRAVAERDATLPDREAAVRTRDRMAAERDEALRARDTAIAERDALARERDEALARRDEALAHRDEALVAHGVLERRLRSELARGHRPARGQTPSGGEEGAPGDGARGLTPSEGDEDTPIGTVAVPATRAAGALLRRGEREPWRPSGIDLWVARGLGGAAALFFVLLMATLVLTIA